MTPETWPAWAAVAVAVISVVHGICTTRRTLVQAEHQTQLQREIAEAAARPYVWADVRGSDYQGQLVDVVLGNSGPTVATNVRVTFDPPLPVEVWLKEKEGSSERGLERIADGIKSLAPGKTLVWSLGVGATRLQGRDPRPHTVTINADGPSGPIPELQYVIDLSDFRESSERPTGSLHLLTKAVTDGLKPLGKD